MGFYRFRSNIDLFENRISNGAKASLTDSKVKITRYSGTKHEKILEVDKEHFFDKMKEHPTILKRMKENIRRRIQVWKRK